MVVDSNMAHTQHFRWCMVYYTLHHVNGLVNGNRVHLSRSAMTLLCKSNMTNTFIIRVSLQVSEWVKRIKQWTNIWKWKHKEYIKGSETTNTKTKEPHNYQASTSTKEQPNSQTCIQFTNSSLLCPSELKHWFIIT